MNRTLVLAFAAVVAGSPLKAQGAAQQAPGARDSVTRSQLEMAVRRNFARVVRNRVGLTDAQMAKLGPISQKYEQQRRLLQIEERDTRVSLRQKIRDESADTAEVSRLLRTLVELQQRRSHILAAEQIELATIMTPLQRAKYMAMQEQIRRRLEQLRQRRNPLSAEGDGAMPPRRRPPF